MKISDLEKAFTKKRTVSLSGKVWHLISPWIPLGRLFPANTIDRKMPEVSDKAAAELKDTKMLVITALMIALRVALKPTRQSNKNSKRFKAA